MKYGAEIVMWFFLGCMLVLVVTHAPGFAAAVTAVGTEGNSMSTSLAGSNY